MVVCPFWGIQERPPLPLWLGWVFFPFLVASSLGAFFCPSGFFSWGRGALLVLFSLVVTKGPTPLPPVGCVVPIFGECRGNRPCHCGLAVFCCRWVVFFCPLGFVVGYGGCPGHWFLPPLDDFRHARPNGLATGVILVLFLSYFCRF